MEQRQKNFSSSSSSFFGRQKEDCSKDQYAGQPTSIPPTSFSLCGQIQPRRIFYSHSCYLNAIASWATKSGRQ
jgi:hypothetical protein